MISIDQSKLHEALRLLGELMQLKNRQELHLVVCGGSSLLALGLVSRPTTRDVDILGRFEDQKIVTPRPLPEWFLTDAEDVRIQLNLPKDWLNAEVADESLFHSGLPEGLPSRLTKFDYGTRLQISFIGRRDQVFLKLHAAVDRDGGRHLQDLKDLQPNAEELLEAARWTRKQDPSEGFRFNLKAMLNQIGHGNVADQL